MKARNTQARVVLGETASLMQLSRSGLDLLLANPEYRNNQLMITSNLTNQGTSPIIRAVIQYRLMDSDSKELDSGQKVVWQSIKRVPDTYLRSGMIKTGNLLKFKIPEKEQYFLEASIVEVDVR